jgi:RimJ/RimL family protein N-acetyltransferase
MVKGAGEVVLRDVTEGDLPIFFEQQLDPEATAVAAFPPRDLDKFMAHWSSKVLGDPSVVVKTVLFEGRVAGNVVCFERSGLREIGYWIGREYWGKGVATRALSAFLDLVPARPLYAHVAVHNVASIRVLEKCGFTPSEDDSGPSIEDDGVEELFLELRE